MLEVDDGQQLVNELWKTTSANVDVPDSIMRSFFAAQGATPVYHNNQRSYHRHFMRGKAVLIRQESLFGIYVKDVSRQGIGFLSPVSLLPKERIKILLPSAELVIDVTRCRRIEAACFECGSRFRNSNKISSPPGSALE